jgi:hypothetical protein
VGCAPVELLFLHMGVTSHADLERDAVIEQDTGGGIAALLRMLGDLILEPAA